jgi:cytochrome c-type biogenesis protein CcmH
MLDKYRYLLNIILLTFVITLLNPGKIGVFAQPGTPNPSDDEINAIARKIYCPVCENIPLDVCSTQACAQWRDLIREKLNQGWTEEQIIAYFAEQYGDRVLATPPVRHFTSLNLLAYIVPPLALIIGIFIIIRYTTIKKSNSPSVAPASSDPANLEKDDPYRKRLEDELRHNS